MARILMLAGLQHRRLELEHLSIAAGWNLSHL